MPETRGRPYITVPRGCHRWMRSIGQWRDGKYHRATYTEFPVIKGLNYRPLCRLWSVMGLTPQQSRGNPPNRLKCACCVAIWNRNYR